MADTPLLPHAPLPAAAAPWQDEDRLASWVTWIAVLLSIIVTLVGPSGYFWLSYQAERNESAVTARLHAAFVTQVIGDAGPHWESSVSDLIETELSASSLPEKRAILDASGGTVTSSGPDVAWPTLRTTAPLMTLQGQLGEVVVQRSIRPLLLRTLLVGLVAAAFGAATYVSLRLLPLRALRRTLAQLRRQESEARERVEEHLRIVLDNALEGIIVFHPSGRFVSCNQAAMRMLGELSDVDGMSIGDVLRPLSGHPPDDPFPVGQHETVARRLGGSEFPVEVSISEMQVTGAPQRIGIFRDITERKQHEARLSHLANFDSLTGLPNRSLFRDRLQQAMARSRRSRRPMALMFIDLDRFKNINDSLGHEVGDLLLVEVSKVLSACVRETDSLGLNVAPGRSAADGDAHDDGQVFRLGGDEFTVLVEDLTDPEAVATIAKRILETVTKPLMVGEHEIFISASIGITVYTDDGTDLDGLIKQADIAMYRSKELGRDTYFYFNEGLNKEIVARHQLETQLRHALERNEFLLHYQPKADLETGRITGVEALMRWRPAGQSLIGPDKFIPILEETGLIVPTGSWAFREACSQMVSWRRQGMPALNLAVNLSAREFRQPDLIGRMADALAETGFDPTCLEIELTESILIEDSEAVLRILSKLGSMGVKIAIDDFGTGHSSLSYLKRFDVDTLKIDRSFVRDTPGDGEDSAIAIAVIALAHGLGLRVVAEGVETEEQKEFLRAQGCDEMQGYLLSRPVDSVAFAKWFGEYQGAMATA
jgi:PAS domain S-box-containing protein